jgi:hypothetical protein
LDAWADILEYPSEFEFIKPLLKEGLHIIESRCRFMANKLDDLPIFRENIMGCVSYERLLSVLRHYPVLIMSAKSLSSATARAWQTLEAVACGCSVLTNGSLQGISEEIAIQVSSNEVLGQKTKALLTNRIDRQKQSHLARRKLYASHSYSHRIQTICKALGIAHGWEEYPLVSVVMPTKRPGLIQACLDKFISQRYPRKELIIVVNTDDVNMTDIRHMASELTKVHIFQMHQEKNIGACLNFGIAQAQGKYWFKMDDDDYYGPNYLLDMVHLTRCADFNVIGKPPGFIYLEEQGDIYLRNNALRSQHIIDVVEMPHLCGATLGGPLDSFTGFSESHRACVDTNFALSARDCGKTLITGDIWNYVAFRAEDKTRHTWRHDDQGIQKAAVRFAHGLDLESIMI